MSSDVSVRMKLNDDVTPKLKKVAAAGKEAANQLKTAGQSIDNAFRSDAPSEFASEAGAALNETANEAESLGNAIDSALSGFNNIPAGAYQDKNGRWHDANGKFIKSLGDTSKSIKDVDDSLAGLGSGGSGLGNLGAEAETAGSSMEAASAHAINFGNALRTLFGVAAGAAVLGGIKNYAMDSVNLGKDYTSMMSEVQAISGASGKDLEMLQETAREYGATTVFSASEAAEALKYMSLAGWDAQQSSSALGGVLNLAAASGMGLGEASDMVTDYLSAFGMEASQSTYLADMLAYAQSNSNTTALQLGEAYRNSAANLHAAGQDVETTTSLLEAMANQGYKGSEAGTALAATMRDITQNMEDGAIKIGETSIAVQNEKGNFRDLTDILTDVEAATAGMGDAEKAAALGSTFTADSIKALNMILTEGMGKVSGYEEALRKSAGTSEEMAGIMTDNLSGDIANMESAMEEMKLQTFEAMEDPLRDLTQYTTNTVIPSLTEWVPDAFGTLASGVKEVGSALAPMLETILKNPKAVGNALTSIGAGFVAMKTVNTGFNIASKISQNEGIVKTLTNFGKILFGSPWAAGAAGFAAAATFIGSKIHQYNEAQIDKSLTDHFGSVELDADQIEDFASRVIDAEWLVNINAALGAFENSDELAEQAEEALAENDSLEWRAKIGIKLDENEVATYIANINTFGDNIESALSEVTRGAQAVVDEFDLKGSDGSSLGSKIAEWAKEDLSEVSYISAGLTNLVQTALEDGILDVNEQAAIDQLQTKMSNILAGWKEAEAQAEMDILTQKYGRLSGKDLTSDTFTKVVEEVGEQRETAMSALEESEKKLFTTLNALTRKDENGVQRIGGGIDKDGNAYGELAYYKEQAGEAIRNEEAIILNDSLRFENNTFEDAYGKEIDKSFESIQKNTATGLERMNTFLENQDYENLGSALQRGMINGITARTNIDKADRGAIADIYEIMKPDVESMGAIIDQYTAMGQKVPEEIMSEFNQAIQTGAVAGDADAAWQVFANEMVAEPANEALVQAIEEGAISVPEEFQTALSRARADVTPDPLTVDGMQVKVEEIEADEAQVGELINKAFEGLEATGIEKEVNGTATVEYEVVAGDTLSGIAETVGSTVDELLTYNPQITDPNVINVGAKINVPKELVAVDASGAGEAADEALKNETKEPKTQEQPVNTKYTDAGTDDSELKAAAESKESTQEPTESTVPTTITFEVSGINDEALAGATTDYLKTNMQAIPVEVPANITLNAGTIDSSQAVSTVQSNVSTAFATALPADGTVDVTLAKGNDNIGEVYDYVGGLVRSAWSNPYSASGTVNVTLTANYSLANPTKTISFGGGATGSATVTAALHADGGIFDQPHFGVLAEAGPEAYIPLDGSENAKSIWREAGTRLGLLEENPISVPPAMAPSSSGDSSEKRSIKDYNININGSGKFQASGGVSRKDVVQIIMDEIKDVIINLVQDEILTEGDGVYEY